LFCEFYKGTQPTDPLLISFEYIKIDKNKKYFFFIRAESVKRMKISLKKNRFFLSKYHRNYKR